MLLETAKFVLPPPCLCKALIGDVDPNESKHALDLFLWHTFPFLRGEKCFGCGPV